MKYSQKLNISAAGEVFAAVQVSTGKRVAIKKMKMEPDIIALLPAEISIMKKCSHKNIVNYFGSYMINRDSLWVSKQIFSRYYFKIFSRYLFFHDFYRLPWN